MSIFSKKTTVQLSSNLPYENILIKEQLISIIPCGSVGCPLEGQMALEAVCVHPVHPYPVPVAKVPHILCVYGVHHGVVLVHVNFI